MGQRPSKEITRLDEINDEQLKVNDLLHTLYNLAAAEAAAGKPATPGSYQARRAAAYDYFMRLDQESTAIFARLSAKYEGRHLPMPDPTPPLCLPPLPEPDAHAASACGGQPGTPMGSARSPTAQRGGSSSSEEGAHAGASGAQSSDAVPLLASGSGRLASGLRRRQGHQEGS